MNQNSLYESPRLEVLPFAEEDIIRTSGIDLPDIELTEI